MKKVKIIFLYSELAGYLMPLFKILSKNYNSEVHVIYWDKNKLKPYKPENLDNVTYYKNSKFNKSELYELVNDLNPSLIYVSGWMDKKYLYSCKRFKRKGVSIVTGFDDRWIGSIKQKIGSIVFPFLYKKYFTHAWVSGPEQYEFAKKLGFKTNKIIFDLLTANTKNFKMIKSDFSKSFIYVGNFRTVKGTDILAEAYNLYKKKYCGDWKLICIGNGPMKNLLQNIDGIEIMPFSNEKKLLEISKKASVFILPSRNDQWGVVVHEFCCLGFPLLLSNNVGSRTIFFIKNFNGLMFKRNSVNDLAKKMFQFSSMDHKIVKQMGLNSFKLSNRISPETSAANLFSVIS